MAILPITLYGDTILRKKAKKIEQIDDSLIGFIADMFETMHNANGIGLAANQVNSDLSLFIVDLSVMDEFKDIKPITLINPEIIEESEETAIFEEGCLSLPNLRADVERPEIIRVKYLDVNENEQILEADDLLARVILHEYDHLIGKMIPDRVDPKSKKKLQNLLSKISKRTMDFDYPVSERC
ncbi:MAG: peptide deformylase [Ignavibacteria bacterium]|nr:MAG: peptide deformylase [Ignavibacteria bacterium]